MTARTAMIAMTVEPIEIDGKHWVRIRMGDREMKKRGPFPNADKAKAEADRIISEWAPAVPAATNDDSIVLHGKSVELTSDLGRKLIVLACRAAENVISDSEFRAEFELFDDAEFKAISDSPALIKALRQERFRRINTGQALRESAAKIVAKGPAQLGRHLESPATSPKHLVEIHRELRQTAHGSGEESPADAAQLFQITINLGADTEPIRIDVPPEDIKRNINKQIEGETVKQE